MGIRLNDAPVCFTLAQMHFNTVLKTDDFLPALQDALRNVGYTDYSTLATQGVEFQQGNEGFTLNQKAVIRHVFRNKAETAELILDPAALTYELTDYSIAEEFSSRFLEALKIVHEHRAIDYVNRIGVRMLDAIQPVNGEALDQYLVPQALGIGGKISTGLKHQQTLTQSIFSEAGRTLVVRILRLPENGSIALPPDLVPLRIKIAERFLTYTRQAAMLDSDCFRDTRSDFEPDTIAAELKDLKSVLSNAFKALVTPHALDVWK